MNENKVQLIKMVDKLMSSPDTRGQSIAFLHSFVLSHFCGNGFIDPFVSDILTNVSQIVLEFPSRRLHDTSLALICLISLSCLDDVEDTFTVFIKEMMLHFNEIKNGQSFRFYAIAVIAAFTLNDEDMCSKILCEYLKIAQNKHPKACKFSPQTVCEIFNGIALMLSMFPEVVCAQTYTNDIMKVIDTGLNSTIPDICNAALNVLTVMYENIENYSPENSDPYMDKKEFVSIYNAKIETAGNRINTKQEKKNIQAKIVEITALFDGRPHVSKVTVNQQYIKVETPSNAVIIDCVKRLTGKNFQQFLGFNTQIQEVLGVKLLSNKEAVIEKKVHRNDLDRGREMTKKEREMKINDRRKKKEMGSEWFD